jgi:hypothetical protein
MIVNDGAACAQYHTRYCMHRVSSMSTYAATGSEDPWAKMKSEIRVDNPRPERGDGTNQDRRKSLPRMEVLHFPTFLPPS